MKKLIYCISRPLFLLLVSGFILCQIFLPLAAMGSGEAALNRLLIKYGIKLENPRYFKIKKKGAVRKNTAEAPSNFHGKQENLPENISKRIVSFSGSGKLKSALMLLSRETGIPVILRRGFPSGLTSTAYYINSPLKNILYGLLTANGLKFKYLNGAIVVYPFEEKIFHIPVPDLFSTFSSSVGIAGGAAPNSQGAYPSDSQAGPAGNASPSGQPNYQGNQNPVVGGLSSPSGYLSLILSESGSLYSIISGNLKKMVSKKGKFFINPKNGLIWVKDRQSNIEEISLYIKNIKKFLSRQVFLNVEVIDLALNKNFQSGINWNILFNSAFKANSAGMSSFSISAPLASANNVINTPYLEFAGEGANSAIIEALKTQGKVDIISQPRLLLMDGQTRLISAGTITPYVSSVQTDVLNLSQTQTYPVISQTQTGLSISFTPHINFKDNTVSVTLSLIDNSISGYQSFSVGGESFSNPVVESKSFSDTVNIKSGSTVIIGGIMTTRKVNNTYGIPWLSRIPLLGNLFISKNIIYEKEDLLIMLTPMIAG